MPSRAPRASDEERRERRRAANRRSAQKSRYREMILMDELQKTVGELTKRNYKLRMENQQFKQQLALLRGLKAESSKQQNANAPRPEKNQVSSNQAILQLQSCGDNDQAMIVPVVAPELNPRADENRCLRTPSPIDSMNLLPDKVFPFEGGVVENQDDLTSAQSLFKTMMTIPSDCPLRAEAPAPFITESV